MQQFSIHASTCGSDARVGFNPMASTCTYREANGFVRQALNLKTCRICQHCGRQTAASTCEGCGAPGGKL